MEAPWDLFAIMLVFAQALVNQHVILPRDQTQLSCLADGLFPICTTRETHGRGIRDQIANICWIIKKLENSRKTSTIYFCFIDYAKALTVWITTNWKILKEMGMPHHLNCLWRNLYAGQEATVRIRHGTMDWFQIGKGVHQGCILLPSLFNLYAEYIMGDAGLDVSQAEIKIARRNINNLRYADDTTLIKEPLDGDERGE